MGGNKPCGQHRLAHPDDSEEWGVTLPDLPHTWSELCVDGILSPGHNASSFIRGLSDPVANIVSAVDLHNDCPSSLLQALADDHPDREVWLNSFYEKKDSLESMNTYRKITMSEYSALRDARRVPLSELKVNVHKYYLYKIHATLIYFFLLVHHRIN